MKLEDLPSLKQVIATHGLSAKKSFGQHFLLDMRTTDRIARTAGNVEGVNVIEIGPGPGGLTRSLLKAGAEKVYAIEKDARFLPILQDIRLCEPSRMVPIEGDATDIHLLELVPPPRKIVANLPYNVSTLLLINWLEAIYKDAGAFQSLTLMFQKEVGERITAVPGNKDYGRLSVLSQWLCQARAEFELPSSAFTPPPKVDSVVVTLTPREKPLVDVSWKAVETVMAAAFGQRRKMLRSALKSLGIDVEKLLSIAGILGNLRAEQLDVVTLCNLARAYQSLAIKSASSA